MVILVICLITKSLAFFGTFQTGFMEEKEIGDLAFFYVRFQCILVKATFLLRLDDMCFLYRWDYLTSYLIIVVTENKNKLKTCMKAPKSRDLGAIPDVHDRKACPGNILHHFISGARRLKAQRRL